jgi:hypothetical protein
VVRRNAHNQTKTDEIENYLRGLKIPQKMFKSLLFGAINTFFKK